MVRLFFFLIYAAIFIFLTAFFLKNDMLVSVSLPLTELQIELPFYIIAISVFLMGVCVGILLQLAKYFSAKRALKRSEKRAASLSDEITQLKSLASRSLTSKS